jgi:hypothetical protein
LIKCEAKNLLQRIEKYGSSVLKMALIKSNGKGGNYIQMVPRAVTALYNTAINLNIPRILTNLLTG